MGVGLQLLFNTFAIAGIYVLVGVGLSLIYRVSKVFHFAHGAIYTIAAYTFFTFMISLHIPLLLALPLAVVVSALVGLGMDQILYQPLTRRCVSGATLIIASLGAYIFFENLMLSKEKLAETFLTISSKYPQTTECQIAIELGNCPYFHGGVLLKVRSNLILSFSF